MKQGCDTQAQGFSRSLRSRRHDRSQHYETGVRHAGAGVFSLRCAPVEMTPAGVVWGASGRAERARTLHPTLAFGVISKEWSRRRND
jgi:hypothetical protein